MQGGEPYVTEVKQKSREYGKPMTDIASNVIGRDINHCGRVSGIIDIDPIGLFELSNREFKHHPNAIVSLGIIVLTTILNRLGLVSAPNVFFSKFLVGKATEHWLTEGIVPEPLNDDIVGRVLDKLPEPAVPQVTKSLKYHRINSMQDARYYQERTSCSHSCGASGLHESGNRYSLGQSALREAQAPANKLNNNLLDNPTTTPTLRWVFQYFQSIHLLIKNRMKQMMGLTDEPLWLLRLLGASCQKYYLLT